MEREPSHCAMKLLSSVVKDRSGRKTNRQIESGNTHVVHPILSVLSRRGADLSVFHQCLTRLKKPIFSHSLMKSPTLFLFQPSLIAIVSSACLPSKYLMHLSHAA